MIKLAVGVAIGFALGSKIRTQDDLEDLLQIAQQTLGNEQVAGLIRAGATALGDAIQVAGTVLTEEVPARLADRRGLHAA